MMIGCEAFFNNHTANVFTDASVKNHGKITEVISGMVSITGHINDPTIIENYIRLLPSTNNEGEIYAIYMAILHCIELRNSSNGKYDTFNIFSDSKISVFGLREWYDGWLKNSREIGSNRLISSSGKEVANQEIFLKCFNAIINNDIHINVYHIRGHIDLTHNNQYEQFVEDFMVSNGIHNTPLKELIQVLVHFNDLVDVGTRERLIPHARNLRTITATEKDIDFSSYKGISIKSEYLFTHDMAKVSKEKNRYASLISCNTNFDK